MRLGSLSVSGPILAYRASIETHEEPTCCGLWCRYVYEVKLWLKTRGSTETYDLVECIKTADRSEAEGILEALENHIGQRFQVFAKYKNSSVKQIIHQVGDANEAMAFVRDQADGDSVLAKETEIYRRAWGRYTNDFTFGYYDSKLNTEYTYDKASDQFIAGGH